MRRVVTQDQGTSLFLVRFLLVFMHHTCHCLFVGLIQQTLYVKGTLAIRQDLLNLRTIPIGQFGTNIWPICKMGLAIIVGHFFLFYGKQAQMSKISAQDADKDSDSDDEPISQETLQAYA